MENTKLVKWIKKLRFQGKSYRQIALITGVSHTTVGNYLKGKTHIIKPKRKKRPYKCIRMYEESFLDLRFLAHSDRCTMIELMEKLTKDEIERRGFIR